MRRGKMRIEAPTFSLPSHRPSRAYFLKFIFILLEKIVFALVVSGYANFLEQKKAISREKSSIPGLIFLVHQHGRRSFIVLYTDIAAVNTSCEMFYTGASAAEIESFATYMYITSNHVE